MARWKKKSRSRKRGGGTSLVRLLEAGAASAGWTGAVATPGTRAVAAPGSPLLSGVTLGSVLSMSSAAAGALLASPSAFIAGLGGRVKLLVMMLGDWWRGRWSFPRGTVAAMLAALAYFVSPIDAIPEVVPLAGYIDDALVIGACLRLIQADLRRYARHRRLDVVGLGL